LKGYARPQNVVYGVFTCQNRQISKYRAVAYTGIMFGKEGRGAPTNSVEDRGQRECRSGCDSPLVRGSAQFANK
jgi:hypothetical protein